MLKGLAQPDSNFFDGEARRDPAAAATAPPALTSDVHIPHFGDGVGPAAPVEGRNVGGSSPSAENRKFSACVPDGQRDVARRKEIEELSDSVCKELGAIQMNEQGGVQQAFASTGSCLAKPGDVTEVHSQANPSAGGDGAYDQAAVEAGGRDCYEAASGTVVHMESDRDGGPSATEFRTVEPSPSEHRWPYPSVEDLPDLGGGSKDAAVPDQGSGSNSIQRSGDYLLARGTPRNADDGSAATSDNCSDDYCHNTVSIPGTASVISPGNSNLFEYSYLEVAPPPTPARNFAAPFATPNYSHVTKENSAPGVLGTNMTKEQFRYCTSVIKNLKRHTSAQVFLKPVDPVALHIPDYPSIIKRPMDLGTVDDKLSKGQYADPNAFAEDVRLVFRNCYLYNGRQSVYSQMAMQLESIFENQLKKVPTGGPSARSTPGSLSRTDAARMGTVTAPPAVAPQVLPAKPAATPRPRPSASRKPITSARKSSNKSSAPSGADRQMRFCSAVLNELCKKQYSEINFPFLQPVNPVALNIPEYLTIIKHPMDLSTIRRKLSAGEYATPRAFESDVNLMFENCFAFNHPGDPVYTKGEQLSEIFRSKWKDLPPPPASKKAAPKPSAKSGVKGGAAAKKISAPAVAKAKISDEGEESDESESEEGDDDESPVLGNLEQLALMEAHMNMMQKRLEELKNATVAVKPSKKKKSRSESTPPGPPGRKSKSGKSSKSKSASATKTAKVEAAANASRRKSTSKAATSLEGEWEELAAGTATAKRKRVKKRRASEVEFTSSGEEGEDGRRQHRFRPASAKESAVTSTPVDNSKPPAKKAKTAAPASPPVILFKHKHQLSEMINSLGEDKLETVIEIIHDSMPHLRGATEEVELDIDALDYDSFYKLYNYVVNDVRPSKKGAGGNKGGGAGSAGKGRSDGNGVATAPDRPGGSGGESDPASPVSAAADATSASSAGDAAASGGLPAAGTEKRKYLSEEEQTQQIMALEEKLKQFADVAAANSLEEDKNEAHNPLSESSDESADSCDESSDGSLA